MRNDRLGILKRRDFLKSAATVSAAAFIGATGGCEQLADQIRNRPVRRSIGILPPNDPIIQVYKAAITAMRALPAADRRSWNQQALIHQNQCPHGNWFFLPWHRAYLLNFEQICRKLGGGDAQWALPYWNWTTHPQIPGVFWGGGASNALFHSNRVATASSTASSAVIGAAVVESILNEPNFFLFASSAASGKRDFSSYGRLEGTPHNSIHGFVGGDMGTFMSPLDPVFWTHHNMIECCWVEWNITRQHPNSNDTQWTQFNFNGDFADADGNSVDVTVAQTFLYPIFSYRFETTQKGTATETQTITEEMSSQDSQNLERFLREGAEVRLEYLSRFELNQALTVEIGTPASAEIGIDAGPAEAAVSSDDQRLILNLQNVTLPHTSDFFVRVFLGMPDAGPDTPIEDPHYAGSFGFFGGGHQEHAAAPGEPKAGFVVDVTDTIRRLRQDGSLPDASRVPVRLVAVPHAGRIPEVRNFTLEKLELAVIRQDQTRGWR